VSTALYVVGLPTGAYGVAQAAENGMYATAVVGAALLAIGAYRLFRGRSASPGQGAQSQVTWERARRAFDAANYGLKYHDPGIDPKLWKQLVEAARLAGQLHNPPSVRLDAEYAGILYLDQQGNVVSTTGVLGPPCVPGADSCSAAPMSDIRGALPPEVTSDRVLAFWHTHGAGAHVPQYDKFSRADVGLTNKVLPYDYPNYVGSFLFTPQGNMLFLPVGYAPGGQNHPGIWLGKVPVK
jgi:hypothetical protein